MPPSTKATAGGVCRRRAASASSTATVNNISTSSKAPSGVMAGAYTSPRALGTPVWTPDAFIRSGNTPFPIRSIDTPGPAARLSRYSLRGIRPWPSCYSGGRLARALPVTASPFTRPVGKLICSIGAL